MEKRSDLYGIILAGGSGSRLWPLSREMHPKQLLKLAKNTTLFQSTFLRLKNVISPENIVTVTNVKHAEEIKLQLNELNSCDYSETNRIVIEPIGRNTAPAIGLATLYILKEIAEINSDPVIIVAPSDHLIKQEDVFANALIEGIKLAESGYIVTFGIKPDKPDTGYGYINTLKDTSIEKTSSQGLKVQEFKEKPDSDTAEIYLNAGTYFWNSGIFMFKASTLMNELNKFCPDVVNILEKSQLQSAGPTIKFDDYEKMPDISIDYAVMEYSNTIALIPIDCGWNDMGSWQAIFDIEDKDERNNFISGNVIDIESENSLIYSTSKLVTTIGLKDTVIIETEDAILACDKNRTQDVKKIFENLKENNDLACKVHRTVFRPWGFYTVLQRGDGFLIKIIQVNPKAKLSLQMHHHRSEHWVVLAGIAKVRKAGEEIILNAGDSIDIPVMVKHSLENPGMIPLKIIEVQNGDYLEEDDIVRFEDIYGRASN
ncbi:MAG: mannose-1-phosphate guanylyltransferase/mannose-6-phosphate isomerase [Candidatus Gastranaerophilales bacterium]|nr:mannose-1-phosphate guanylyltransferase/mannose-6-phosphate isomerase [Candidatus Gastranaerophilales bacterium]